jgi:hypothetical protein
MEIIGSLAARHANEARGFVGYPQSYESDKIIGVDQAGQPFTLLLEVPDNFIEAAKKEKDKPVPKIGAMAETHARAKNPCIAMPDNGPITRSGGCFVAEQVDAVEGQPGVYKAKWLSILKNWETDPEPRFSAGYMETNVKLPFTADAVALKLELIRMNDALRQALASGQEIEQINGIDTLDFYAKRNQLVMDLYLGAEKKWYIGVEMQYRRLEVGSIHNETLFKRQITELIASNSVNGMYGGVILRPVEQVGDKRIVHVDSVRRLSHAFDYKKQAMKPVESVWDEWISKGSGWMKFMKSKGFEVEIIPVQRVNAGPISNDKYSKEYLKGVLPKQLKAWVDQEFHNAPYVNFGNQNAYLVTPMAIRTADTRADKYKGNIMLSSAHAFGKAFGNALELDKDLKRTLTMSQKPMPFVRPTNDSELDR